MSRETRALKADFKKLKDLGLTVAGLLDMIFKVVLRDVASENDNQMFLKS
ncbi:hypothetical protein [Pediococcus ethanolidurans]|nr:hypothetical protein [Pediococcus ethanolidurans]